MLRKIFDHLQSEWYKYVFEMIVVILGILIAFNLEQWSNERGLKRSEIELLKDFKRVLSADLAEMRSIILFHEYSVRSSKLILKVIQEDIPYHDSLDAYFSYTHAFSTFSGREGPIAQLKNTNLAIVSNDSLRLQIISMYDEFYPRIRLVEAAIKRDYEQLRDFDRLSDLKKNPEYAGLLRARISNQIGLLRIHYEPAAETLNDLINKIDSEIARLE